MDTVKLLTSLVLVQLLLGSLALLTHSLPGFVSAVDCFRRIQDYLNRHVEAGHLSPRCTLSRRGTSWRNLTRRCKLAFVTLKQAAIDWSLSELPRPCC